MLVLICCLTCTTWTEEAKPISIVEKLECLADAALFEAIPERQFSGALLIAVDGKPLVRKAYGFADWVRRIPNTPETRFMIFSSTKQLTAAAILRVVDQKKLSLQDPVAQYIDNWPEQWKSVKIHHLLSHSSGIDVDTLAFWLFRFYPQFWPEPQETPPAYEPKGLLAEPGAMFRYSNVGFTVLSMVAEKVSSKPFADAMQDLVFGPLKMAQSGLEGDSALRKRARGHNYPDTEYLEQKTTDIRGAGDVVLRWMIYSAGMSHFMLLIS